MAEDKLNPQVAAAANDSIQDGGAQPDAEVIAAGESGEQTASEIAGQEGTTPAKPSSKVFTEEEVKQREAALTSRLQAEAAQYRQYAAQIEMQRQIAEQQAQEQQARIKDAQELASGNITQEEATARSAQRHQVAELQRTIQAQRQQGEVLGKVTMAYDLGVKYGVNPQELLDPGIKTPVDMMQKVLDLAVKARDHKVRALKAKPETFDKGPSSDTTKTTNADKIIRLYAEGESGVTRQQYEAAMKQKGLL